MVVVSTNKENDMNESTLVPRKEISDLDWLVRVTGGTIEPWCEFIARSGLDSWACTRVFDLERHWFTREQYLARRAELQNKPDWECAPDWAQWLAQDVDGEWFWYKGKPVARENTFHSGKCSSASYGLVIGNWRDTLEKRPADLSERAVTFRLKEATDNVLAAAPELMTDKFKFEPFVSVEDANPKFPRDVDYVGKINAATAKQPAPKGSGSTILGMVLADLTNRALEGKEKYGEPLLAHNGRNPLWDAYQEALDLAMYLRQAIEEQKQ